MALTDNLVAYYKLDGNSNDSVGSNNLVDTSVSYVSAKINNGASYGGSSYSKLASNLGITNGAITIAGWFKPSVYLSSYNCLVGLTDSSTFVSYYIERSSSTNVNFARDKGSIGPQQVGATYTFDGSSLYHLALTYDGTTLIAYINGIAYGSVSASGNGSGSMTNTGFCINGRYYNSSTPINAFSQVADEIGIWSRALSADEVSQIFNSGRGNAYPLTDTPSLYGGVAYYKLDGNSNDSVGSNNGTDTSISYSSSYGKINQGALFVSATSSYIKATNTPIPAGTSGLSYAFWVNFVSLSGVQQMIQQDSDANNGAFGITQANGTDIYCNYKNSGGTNYQIHISSAGLSTSTWYFFTITVSGGTMTLYKNGTSIGTVSVTGTVGSSSAEFDLGRNPASGSYYYLNGYIDEVGIWSRALTSTEVTTLYNSGAGLQYPFTTNKPSLFPFFSNYI